MFTNTDQTHANETAYTDIDQLLETEKQQNKADAWNKLDKTVKIQKLHVFAEKYGKDNTLPVKDVKALKHFFSESLEKNKLQKTKDVVYDKEKGSIQSIPALFFNITNRAFTLKHMDAKRVSTLKSLTPSRSTPSRSTPSRSTPSRSTPSTRPTEEKEEN
jgi:hypothetical protein